LPAAASGACRTLCAVMMASCRRGLATRAAMCPTRPSAITAPMPKRSRSSSIPPESPTESFWSSSSRSTIRARAIVRAMTSERATDQRSSTQAMNRGGSPKTRSPMSRHPGYGLAGLSPRSLRQATSGKPSPSIRTILNGIPPATPAILSVLTGGCRFEKTPLQSKRENLPSKRAVSARRRRCVAGGLGRQRPGQNAA
jgi:hypothetical protein